VADILASLGVTAATPQIEVWNKLDLVDASAREALTAQAAQRAMVHPVSALTGEGVDALLALISETLDEDRHEAVLDLPFAEGRRRAWLHDRGIVQSETETEDGWHLQVRWTARQEAQWQRL
jgi:GTP-binding protein HflX